MTFPRIVNVPPPEPRIPRMVEDDTRTDGERLILVPPPPEPERRDLRGWGDPHRNADGDMVVRVVDEETWYEYRLWEPDRQTLRLPAPLWREYSAEVLWLE